MSIYDHYESIIGLEVHIQLNTKSKAYSSDENLYGGSPNTYIHPITLALPGTLPVMNKETIASAVKLGLALDCNIRYENQFARKNYFYADLPKGYQITQDKTPICTGGKISFEVKDEAGKVYEKNVGITRIHMEEDAGKSIHDLDPYYTLIDLNRAGVPLLEIVSEADMRTSLEAAQYLTEIRKLVRFLEICDGNMEEGSLRCDVNISVKKKDVAQWGTKVEIKNMNSMRNVRKAIEYEFVRQIDLIESGETIQQQTRNFDAVTGTTIALRSKEEAHDYRYFPEPDLPPIYVDEEYVSEVKALMPALPKQLLLKYMTEYNLTKYDASLLSDEKDTAYYFDQLVAQKIAPKTAANWLLGPIKNYLNEKSVSISEFPLKAGALAELLLLVESQKVSNTAAQSTILPEMLDGSSLTPLQIAEAKNILQVSDSSALESIVDQVLASYPEKIIEFQNGKKGLMGLFVGESMKASGGKADPKVLTQILNNKLNK